MMKLSRLALLTVLVTMAGCYHYVPEAGRTLSQGTPIRIRLEQSRSFELPALTVHNIGVVTAEMVREEQGGVIVSTRWLDAVTGEGFNGQNWTFTIPRRSVASLEVRTLSSWRTAAVFAAGFLATYLGWDALRGSDDPGGGSGTGGVAR